MGDPIGPPADREELVWRFRDLADRAGAWSVFYQVSADQLPVYVDAGLRGRRVAMGAGAHGFSAFVAIDDLVAAYDATVADIAG